MHATEGFEEFVATVEHGSVTAAAESLATPRPTVSRRLARLEEHLGVRLLHRSTRRLVLTPEGELLYPKARDIVEASKHALAEVQQLDEVPRGLLRISLPAGSPAAVMAEWLDDFQRRYPELTLEIASNIDGQLVAEGFDVAFRRGLLDHPSLYARHLVADWTIAVASPDYLETRGHPTSAADLRDHDCIVALGPGGTPDLQWSAFDDNPVDVQRRWATTDVDLRIALAKRGLGIAIVSAHTAMPELDAGNLVHVLPEVIGRRENVCLVYTERRSPKVRAFVEFIVEMTTRPGRSMPPCPKAS